MSDPIKHECGIALLRLKKDLSYYQEKYGTWMYGLDRMYLLMEKQHNRGQDGAGLVSLKLNLPPGKRYIDRARAVGPSSIKEVYAQIHSPLGRLEAGRMADPLYCGEHAPFAGELLLGHLRYGTYGGDEIEHVHPHIRNNNWKSRTLVLAGNFNLTNTPELFDLLVSLGQHPMDRSDTVTVLEKLGHYLDTANQELFRRYKDEGVPNIDISALIAQNLDVGRLLADATKDFDGGYAMAGLIGHGDAFVCRDPWGIRPAYFMENEEFAVVASERPVIQTVLNVPVDQVQEVKPGYAFIIRRDGSTQHVKVREPQQRASCSFERIYFSRGTDRDIYRERLRLGELLAPQIIEAAGGDADSMVFSYIPNTAETAFYGMVKGLEDRLNARKVALLTDGSARTPEEVAAIIDQRLRVEKIAVKDIKLRTFITQDAQRQGMVQHVYDITYGTLRPGEDTLVIIDDSIVRGTTLRESILRILDRLGPKRIVVVSSSPQIRYPDCYGIDMARLEDFIAFRAAIDLLGLRGFGHIIQRVYHACISENAKPERQVRNCVKEIYEPFTDEELAEHMAKMLKHPAIRADVSLVFQTIENLHAACPNDTGDWYFTGDYPTPGGNRVANNAFINYMEGNHRRAY
ncbi:MAG: amidophosphoribosyltransferase [Bacteroidia bacterium]|nr:MAG: amidophosphoribosyltransferase [Bacteroidia bacterium]